MVARWPISVLKENCKRKKPGEPGLKTTILVYVNSAITTFGITASNNNPNYTSVITTLD
jgi:hypothetical protein